MACTPHAPHESDVKLALPLMVIDEASFGLNHLRPCGHMRECQTPLICSDKRCQIPPSLLGRPSATTPKLSFVTGDKKSSIYLEIADDDYSTARGMMHRRAFHPDWGMLFVFKNDEQRSFWMANCHIALDMIFIRKDGSIDAIIEGAAPLDTEPRYPSKGPTRFVLELPVKSIGRLGIDKTTVFDVGGFL